MIRFLIKGLLRDRHKSIFPLITVTLGVMLTVVMQCWLKGIFGDIVDYSARFSTGHVKVATQAYLDNLDQMPNDVALSEVDSILTVLQQQFPEIQWTKRIHFGGLVDIPDANGETLAQGPAIGLALELFAPETGERKRLNIEKALVQGQLPQHSGEMLLSDELARKLDVKMGDTATILSSTMYGGMALANLTVSGTVRFGVQAMDRGTLICDLHDAQDLLDMADSVSEILGYFRDGLYHAERAAQIAQFKIGQEMGYQGELTPVIVTLEQQNELAGMIQYADDVSNLAVVVFIVVMSIVLWNAGLIGVLRRYGEMGVRLAIGETKDHVYRSLLVEAACIGLIGSIIGTLAGLGIGSVLQTKGLDFSDVMKSASMMIPTVFRARITPAAYYIGIIPGLCSTLLGNALSGIGIYRRKTANLFKELEV